MGVWIVRRSWTRKAWRNLPESCSSCPNIDVVTALHACDTATDDAIALACKSRRATWCWCLAAKPEMARLPNANKALALAHAAGRAVAAALYTREMGSQITNVTRCLYLEAQGYQVTVTEAGRLGAQHEERTHHCRTHRSTQTTPPRATCKP